MSFLSRLLRRFQVVRRDDHRRRPVQVENWHNWYKRDQCNKRQCRALRQHGIHLHPDEWHVPRR